MFLRHVTGFVQIGHIYLAIYERSLKKIQCWESSLVDPEKSFVSRKLTWTNTNGGLFQSETIH